MDKETEILCRLAANHLHLAQFEPLKATLLALRVRNPDLALTILQTIVSNAGRFENVLWSRSCPSPSLLSFLSTIELLRFENPTAPWGFDSETLSLRTDFLLMLQVLIDRVTERIKEDQRVELGSVSGEVEEKRDENEGLGNCLRVLKGVLELGVERLKFDVDTSSSEGSNKIEEIAVVSLRSIVLDYSDVFDALCSNIKRQLLGCESYDTCLVEEVQGEDQGTQRNNATRIGSQEPNKDNVFALIQRNVQLAQLDAMRTKLDEGDERGAADRIRYLHLDYGVEKENYQYVLDLYSPQIHKVSYCLKKSEVFGLFGCIFCHDCSFVMIVPLSFTFPFVALNVFAKVYAKQEKELITFFPSVCLYTDSFHVP